MQKKDKIKDKLKKKKTKRKSTQKKERSPLFFLLDSPKCRPK
jgi:hypothetical protein